ncbi:MAG: PKD domain-containing protein, partial [Bacteroidota bacterium]
MNQRVQVTFQTESRISPAGTSQQSKNNRGARVMAAAVLLLLFQQVAGYSQGVSFSATPGSVSSTSCTSPSVSFSGTVNPSQSTVASANFNSGSVPSGWSSTGFQSSACSYNSPDNTNYWWATTRDANLYRWVSTGDVDVSLGGSLDYYIRYAAGNNPCEQLESSNEVVALQYSTNNGASWTTFYNGLAATPGSAWYTGWYAESITIPSGARTSSTRFRWIQLFNDGDQNDHWGLEDIQVIATTPSPTINSWSWNFGDGGTATGQNATHSFPNVQGTNNYTVTLTAVSSTNQTYTSTSTYTVNISGTNPTSGGTIDNPQCGAANFNPSAITSLSLPSGQTGALEYKWQMSTTSATSGFSDISSSNSATYDPGPVAVNTWFRRLARVVCISNWTGAAASNAILMTVTPTFTDPADLTLYTDTDGVACPASNSVSPAASQSVHLATGGAAFTYTVNGVTRNGPTDYTEPCFSGSSLKIYLWAVNLNKTGTSGTCSRQIELTWRVYDTEGDYAEQRQLITIVDRTKPTFTRPVDGTFTAAGCAYVQQLPAVTGDVTNESDNCQTGLDATFSDGAPTAGVCPGTFTVNRTWSLVDGCGNAATTQVQVITINENTAPEVSSTNSPNDPDIDAYSCGTSFTYNAGPSTCFINKTVAKPTWTDACGGAVTRAHSADNGVTLSNYGDFVGANFPVGTTIVTFSATDCPGNTGYCTISVIVNDTQNPTITGCPTNQTATADPDSCSRLLNLVIPTAGDNCSVASVTYSTSGATTLSGLEFPNP